MTFKPTPPKKKKKQKQKQKQKQNQAKQNKNGFEIFRMGEKVAGCGCNYWHE